MHLRFNQIMLCTSLTELLSFVCFRLIKSYSRFLQVIYSSTKTTSYHSRPPHAQSTKPGSYHSRPSHAQNPVPTTPDRLTHKTWFLPLPTASRTIDYLKSHVAQKKSSSKNLPRSPCVWSPTTSDKAA
jgi:hypothetical protein